MSLLTPGKIKHADHLDRAKYLFIWRLTLAFTVLLPILCVLFYFTEDSYGYITYAAGFLIAFSGLLFLYFKQQFKVIFLLYTILGTIIIQADLYFISNSHHYANFIWIIMLIILAFHGVGKKYGALILILNAAGTSYYFISAMYGHYKIVMETNHSSAFLVAIEVPAIMTVIAYLIYLNNKANKEIQNDLITANNTLGEINAEILKRDKEKTILVKEIHHRVKNNLQIIISLLRLQMSEVKSAESRKHFSEAINRVLVMSSIHQKLYRQEEVTEFELDEYIRELAIELKTFFLEDFPIEFDIKSSYNELDLKMIVPLGLILNELISNSLKYAFENKSSGKISIHVEDTDDTFVMVYADNGLWKKSTTAIRGFGSELIEILTEQLNGIVTFKSNNEGTSYTFNFKKLKHEQ